VNGATETDANLDPRMHWYNLLLYKVLRYGFIGIF